MKHCLGHVVGLLLLAGCAAPIAPPSPDAARQAQRLEEEYRRAPATLDDRLPTIYQIAALPAAVAVPSLARLFVAESQTDLKAEILSALHDPDGEVDAKLSLLTVAILPDQPFEVRRTAIETMTGLADPRALNLLQGLVTDHDPLIREAAMSAITAFGGADRPR